MEKKVLIVDDEPNLAQYLAALETLNTIDARDLKFPEPKGGWLPNVWGPVQQYRRDTPKVGRNDMCPCNSGKKYKKCHGELV